jgi:hypothetical protein
MRFTRGVYEGGDQMVFVPLSHGEDGIAFEIPDNEDGNGPAGWLVLRKSTEGRGRPAVVHHRNGKPLIIPVDATQYAKRDQQILTLGSILKELFKRPGSVV